MLRREEDYDKRYYKSRYGEPEREEERLVFFGRQRLGAFGAGEQAFEGYYPRKGAGKSSGNLPAGLYLFVTYLP